MNLHISSCRNTPNVTALLKNIPVFVMLIPAFGMFSLFFFGGVEIEMIRDAFILHNLFALSWETRLG